MNHTEKLAVARLRRTLMKLEKSTLVEALLVSVEGLTPENQWQKIDRLLATLEKRS